MFYNLLKLFWICYCFVHNFFLTSDSVVINIDFLPETAMLTFKTTHLIFSLWEDQYIQL